MAVIYIPCLWTLTIQTIFTVQISLRIKNEITIIHLFVVQRTWQYYCEIESEIEAHMTGIRPVK